MRQCFSVSYLISFVDRVIIFHTSANGTLRRCGVEPTESQIGCLMQTSGRIMVAAELLVRLINCITAPITVKIQ